MIKNIEMNELQLFIYYQFIFLVENPTEVVEVSFSVKSSKHLNVLFQVNLLLGTTMNVKGNTVTTLLDAKTVKKLIVLAGKNPELIKAL